MTTKLDELRAAQEKARSATQLYGQWIDARSDVAARYRAQERTAWAKFDTALAAVGEEMERLREALKPFANEAMSWDDEEPDQTDLFDIASAGENKVTLGDFRSAACALHGDQP